MVSENGKGYILKTVSYEKQKMGNQVVLESIYSKHLEFTLADNNKLELYSSFRYKNGMDTYLENIKDSRFRRCLTSSS